MFLGFGSFFEILDVVVGQLLDVVVGLAVVVLADLLRLEQLLDRIVGVSADIANRNPVILNHTTPSRDHNPGAYPLTGRGDIAIDQESFDDDVVAALMSLDETARACLLMKTVLDLPYREIAAALGVPEGTAMSHVHRARGALRERLATGDETRMSSA